MKTLWKGSNGKMKILVVSQHYAPEPFRLPDILEELVRRGHEVTVITGVPNYPMGRIYPGYGFGKKKDEVLNGVKVHRSFTIARRTGTLFRFLNYYSFSIASTLYAAGIREKFDVVFMNQTSPVMMVRAGLRYAKKTGTPSVLYCMDLWPESLTAGGIKKDSFVYRLYKKVSEKIYKKCDRILCTSASHKKYFSDMFGIENVHYLPQYAEDIFLPADCRKEPDAFTDFMFAGNLGAAQSLYTIIEAAKLLRDRKDIRFHFVGDGIESDNLRKQAEGLSNVFFYGRRPLTEMPDFYRTADCMLVTLQNDPVLSYTLPGKVQTYMAAGKPVLGSISGEAVKIIEESGAGFVAPPEDAEKFAEIAVKFADFRDKEQFARASRTYYENHFRKELFFEKLLKELKESI